MTLRIQREHASETLPADHAPDTELRNPPNRLMLAPSKKKQVGVRAVDP